MFKRIFALALALACCFAVLPAAAEAETLTGWTSKVDYDNTDPYKYVVEIDLTNQVITVYESAIGGPIVLQSLCTTGSDEYPTGRGTFRMGELKERFGYFVAYGQYAQYWSQVVRGVYIHSVMYNSTNLSSMSKSAYRNLGKNVSHGCVRVLPHVAQWIFYNCPPGTVCKIVKKAKDDALVSTIKQTIPSYDHYVQPTDTKADPELIPALIGVDDVPLRTGFSTSKDKTIETLDAGDKVFLLQIGQQWCKVKTEKGKLGYVKTQYIIAYPDAAGQSTTSYTAKSRTYIYESASTEAKKLVRIPSGAAVDVSYRVSKYWWYGTYNGVTGYLRVKYVIESTAYTYPTLDETGTSVLGGSLSDGDLQDGGSSGGMGSSSSSGTLG